MEGLRFSSRWLPPPRRAQITRDLLMEHVALDLQPAGTDEFHFELACLPLQGVTITEFRGSTLRLTRDRLLSAQLGDNLEISIMIEGQAEGSIAGRGDYHYKPGGSMVHSSESPGTFITTPPHVVMVKLPRSRALAAGIELGAYTCVKDSAELRFLGRYLQPLFGAEPVPPTLAPLLSQQIIDLTLLALGARGSAAEIARHRGLKAARLAAVKADMRRRLHEPGLSLDQLAHQHGLSPRYLRALFAAEDTSFSDTLLLQRLAEAHRSLTAPEKAGLTITEIAYAAGFNDLSYFNRAFKRRFGLTPREVRQGLQL